MSSLSTSTWRDQIAVGRWCHHSCKTSTEKLPMSKAPSTGLNCSSINTSSSSSSTWTWRDQIAFGRWCHHSWKTSTKRETDRGTKHIQKLPMSLSPLNRPVDSGCLRVLIKSCRAGQRGIALLSNWIIPPALLPRDFLLWRVADLLLSPLPTGGWNRWWGWDLALLACWMRWLHLCDRRPDSCLRGED